MSQPQRIEALAVKVCQTIRDVRKENQAWINIDGLHSPLDCNGPYAVDAAIAFARAKGWLMISGTPAHSVLLRQGAP